MKIYTVKKIFQYSENVEVAAESEEAAMRAADFADGESNNDDRLYSCEVVDEREVGDE